MSASMIFKIPYFMAKRYMLMKASNRYWQRKMRGKSLKVDGRTLNPRAQALIELQSEFGAPVEQWTVPMIRGGYTKSMSLFDGLKQDVTVVKDLTLNLSGRTIRARLYDPKPEQSDKPCLLYFHGGGFVIGGLESHDRLCRKIALQSDAPVVAVDYRLGPENRFPAAMLDALDSWTWLQEKAASFDIDPMRITVGGDSAGAALALLITGEASKGELGSVPIATTLIYPPMMDTPDTSSRRLLSKENIVLTKDLLDWFSEHFSDDSQVEYQDYLSPLKTAVKGKIGPVWIRTCGFDPLRDDGVIIDHRLKELGADVDFAEYDDLYHGFIGASAILVDVDKMVADLARFVVANSVEKSEETTVQAAE
ncbi:MAG: alpha/beta hydrolase [Sneathiella sp.]